MSARYAARQGAELRAHLPCEKAQLGAHPLCDARALGGRDLATRHRRQNGCEDLQTMLGCAQRRRVDTEALRRIEGGGKSCVASGRNR